MSISRPAGAEGLVSLAIFSGRPRHRRAPEPARSDHPRAGAAPSRSQAGV